jgi:enoyl-CoA hydratase
VNGPAWGAGAELALRCDLRVMDGSATLCMIGVRMGLTPILGGGPALTQLVGPSRAADLLLSARKVPAVEAFSLGLVNRITEPGQALDNALRLAFSISRNGQHAVRAVLRVTRGSAGLDADAGLALEREAAARVIMSGDFLIAMRAALNKTEAVFPDVP